MPMPWDFLRPSGRTWTASFLRPSGIMSILSYDQAGRGPRRPSQNRPRRVQLVPLLLLHRRTCGSSCPPPPPLIVFTTRITTRPPFPRLLLQRPGAARHHHGLPPRLFPWRRRLCPLLLRRGGVLFLQGLPPTEQQQATGSGVCPAAVGVGPICAGLRRIPPRSLEKNFVPGGTISTIGGPPRRNPRKNRRR